MQINKIKTDISEILSDVFDGATIMVGGFGEAGSPIELLHGLIDHGAKDLTIQMSNTGKQKKKLFLDIQENILMKFQVQMRLNYYRKFFHEISQKLKKEDAPISLPATTMEE